MKYSLFDNLPLNPEHDPIMMGLHGGYNLAAPWSFWTASPELRSEVVNGCGPGGLGDLIVPDRILGLNMKPACQIHDWMYCVYNDKAGFALANNLFRNNMVRINQQHNGLKILKQLRLPLIRKYFEAVDCFGEVFFFDAHLELI